MIRRGMKLMAVVGLVLMLTVPLVGGAVDAKPEAAGGGRWIVVFEKGVNAAAKEAIVKGAGGVIEMPLEALDMAIVWLPSQAAKGLETAAGVRWVEEDSYRYYHLQPLPWGIDRIDAEWVWPHADGNTGDSVNVAVLDTGIDTDHLDLAANLEGKYSCVNRDTSNVEDKNGHGTHCSGIIAALNNEIGVVGVGPDIDLWMVQISRGTRIRLSDIIEGINWCIGTQGTANPIQVMSMSFGGGYSESEDDALQTAYEAGIVLVSSAGNGYGGAVTYPAKLPQVIAVSAVDRYDQIATFSSMGTEVELAAPGVSIYSTYLSGGYGTMSGTSMAGPHVAGVAALVIATGITDTDLEGEDGYGRINDEVRERLQLTAEDIGLPSDQQGYGLVDAENAVLGTTNGNDLGADTTAPAISDVVASDITASSATITWTTNEASDSLVRYGTAIPPTSEAADATMVTSHSISLTGLTAETTYYYEVQSTDGSGNAAVDNNDGVYYSFTTAAADTTAPLISDVVASDITASSATITWTTDEDSDSVVRYGTAVPPTSEAADTTMVTSHSVSLTGLTAETTYYYEVQSNDGSGNTAVDDNGGEYYTFTTEAAAPALSVTVLTDASYTIGDTVYITAVVTDAAGAPVLNASVYVEVITGRGAVRYTGDDTTDIDGKASFQYTIATRDGTGTYTVTADALHPDYESGSASAQFTVTK